MTEWRWPAEIPAPGAVWRPEAAPALPWEHSEPPGLRPTEVPVPPAAPSPGTTVPAVDAGGSGTAQRVTDRNKAQSAPDWTKTAQAEVAQDEPAEDSRSGDEGRRLWRATLAESRRRGLGPAAVQARPDTPVADDHGESTVDEGSPGAPPGMEVATAEQDRPPPGEPGRAVGRAGVEGRAATPPAVGEAGSAAPPPRDTGVARPAAQQVPLAPEVQETPVPPVPPPGGATRAVGMGTARAAVAGTADEQSSAGEVRDPEAARPQPIAVTAEAEEAPPRPAGMVPPDAVEKPPERAVAAVRQARGVDLDDTPVWRTGPDGRPVDAPRLEARAYTKAGQVFVPAAAGPLDVADNPALVAHELVHVAQQRERRGVVPPESSPEGRLLEREAVAVERWVRDGSGSTGMPPEIADSPPPHGTGVQRAPAPPLVAQPVTPAQPAAAVPRQAEPVPWAESAPQNEPGSHSAARAEPAPPNEPRAVPAPWAEPPAPVVPAETDVHRQALQPRATPSPDARDEQVSRLETAMDGLRQEVAAMRTDRLRHDETLARLAAASPGIDETYERWHRRLRSELLVDRERLGLLSDFT